MPQKRPTPTCGDPGHAANSRTLGKAGFGELGDRRLPPAAHLSARLSRGCTHLQEAASQGAGRSVGPSSVWPCPSGSQAGWPSLEGAGGRRQGAAPRGSSCPGLPTPSQPPGCPGLGRLLAKTNSPSTCALQTTLTGTGLRATQPGNNAKDTI